ncbi:hypothetical protein, partial [Xanthomonas maliensis]|uniref:hypothetical protein n=1 Tax=Xanthomonas maliensis TaxID=1321368 RepID=UPI001EE2BD81
MKTWRSIERFSAARSHGAMAGLIDTTACEASATRMHMEGRLGESRDEAAYRLGMLPAPTDRFRAERDSTHSCRKAVGSLGSQAAQTPDDPVQWLED